MHILYLNCIYIIYLKFKWKNEYCDMTNSYHSITFGFGFVSAVNSPSYSVNWRQPWILSSVRKHSRHPRQPHFLLHSLPVLKVSSNSWGEPRRNVRSERKEGEGVIYLFKSLHLESKTQTRREDEGQFVMHRVVRVEQPLPLKHHPEINLQARNPFCSPHLVQPYSSSSNFCK